MSDKLTPINRAKYIAAFRAVDFVKDGMRLGLGTGSTAEHMVRILAEKINNDGLKIEAVSTSKKTDRLARNLGIKTRDLNELRRLDMTIDGADEFDDDLNLIKGGGAALLKEKIIAAASDRYIIITDASKHVGALGAFPLPVEINKFGWETTRDSIEEMLEGMDVLGHQITPRMTQNGLLETDEGHYLIDLHLKRIGDARALNLRLNQIPGVIENGLFMDMTDTVVIGYGDHSVGIYDLIDGKVKRERIDVNLDQSLFAGL